MRLFRTVQLPLETLEGRSDAVALTASLQQIKDVAVHFSGLNDHVC